MHADGSFTHVRLYSLNAAGTADKLVFWNWNSGNNRTQICPLVLVFAKVNEKRYAPSVEKRGRMETDKITE